MQESMFYSKAVCAHDLVETCWNNFSLPSSSAKQKRCDLRDGFAEDVDPINRSENISNLEQGWNSKGKHCHCQWSDSIMKTPQKHTERF